MIGVANAAGQSRTVRDWTASCDQFSCSAETVGEGGLASGGTGYRLRIERANAGGSGWTVTLVAHNVPKPGDRDSITIAVPGAVLPAMTVTKLDEDRLGFSDQAALAQIFPALRNGTRATLAFAADGATHSESFSLSGLAAVLLWTDEKQGRVGEALTVTALGEAAERSTLADGKAAQFRDRIARLSPVSHCQWNQADGDQSLFRADSYDLGGGSVLHAVPCWRGAYQESAVMFLESGGELRALTFAQYSDAMGWGGTQELTMPEFDEKTKSLFTHTRFRGAGDCGSSAHYQWTPDGFKLMLYTYRACADEVQEDADPDWPVIYRSKDYRQ